MGHLGHGNHSGSPHSNQPTVDVGFIKKEMKSLIKAANFPQHRKAKGAIGTDRLDSTTGARLWKGWTFFGNIQREISPDRVGFKGLPLRR